MEHTEKTKPGPTHMVVYVMSAPAGMEYGNLDVTLPAGWTPGNRDWCRAHLEKTHGRAVAITGVFPYEVTA